jgi:hypothetical protein
VRIGRTLLFLANLARIIPVNPVMLIDTTHHTVESDVAMSTKDPDLADELRDQIDEAPTNNGPHGSKS